MRRIDWRKLGLFFGLNCLLLVGVLGITFQKPRFVRFDKIDFVSVEDSFFNFKILLVMDNKNPFSISGKSLAFTFNESDQQYGSGTIEPFQLKRLSESTVDLSLKLNYRKVLKSYDEKTTDTLLPSVLIKGDFMPAFFIHKINLRKQLGKKELIGLIGAAFSNGGLLWPDSFSIRKVNLLETEIGFNLALVNRLNFDVTINEISGKLYALENRDLPLGDISLQREIVLPPGERLSIPFLVKAENLTIVKSLLKSGTANLNSFFLDGKLVLNIEGESISVPVELSFGKTGN
ncbi:MAG: hypothetical protein ABWZ25_00510 [Chitinophagaceae bacterium]